MRTVVEGFRLRVSGLEPHREPGERAIAEGPARLGFSVDKIKNQCWTNTAGVGYECERVYGCGLNLEPGERDVAKGPEAPPGDENPHLPCMQGSGLI